MRGNGIAAGHWGTNHFPTTTWEGRLADTEGTRRLSDRVFALRAGEVDPALTRVAPDHADDAKITLWALYEQHYRGFDDVDAVLEWHPTLVALRAPSIAVHV